MRRAVRVGLVVLGAAMAVYGAASLTGGWLGTPPWWERELTSGEQLDGRPWSHVPVRPGDTDDWSSLLFLFEPPTRGPREGREWISGGGVAAGLALVAVGAWPRRRRPARQDAARPEHHGKAQARVDEGPTATL